jgi:hypothetical protein
LALGGGHGFEADPHPFNRAAFLAPHPNRSGVNVAGEPLQIGRIIVPTDIAVGAACADQLARVMRFRKRPGAGPLSSARFWHKNEIGTNPLRRQADSCQKIRSSRRFVMTAPQPASDGEAMPDVEAAADESIAICGGDARAAVKALLVANDFLERQLELTRLAVSFGYSRGWHRKRTGRTADAEAQG